MVPNCPRCQIVHVARLSVVTNCPFYFTVPNCRRCQIVRGAKLSAVPNCPVPNFPGAWLSYNPPLFVCSQISLVPNSLVLDCLGVKLSWWQIAPVPNYLGSNCHGAKMSGEKLSWCQIFLVPICPGAKLSWCYIVIVPNWLGAKLSSIKLSCCQIVLCQISLVPFVVKANFQYIFFYTIHILHIFAFDTNFQLFAISYILIICSLRLHKFCYDSQIHNVLTCGNTLNFSEWIFFHFFISQFAWFRSWGVW